MCTFSPLLDYTLFKDKVFILEFVTTSKMPTMAGSRISLNLCSGSVAANEETESRQKETEKLWVR